MSKKPTPMQEHIEWINEVIHKAETDTNNPERIPFIFALGMVKAHAKSKLEKEREAMCNFANEYADQVMGGMTKRAEEYFNETFKSAE